MQTDLVSSVAFAALFSLVFLATDHHIRAPETWNKAQPDILRDVERRLISGSLQRRSAFGACLFLWLLLVGILRMRIPSPKASALVISAFCWLLWETSSIAWSKHLGTSLRRIVPWIITCAIGFVTGSGLGTVGTARTIFTICSGFAVGGVLNEALRGYLLKRTSYRFAGTLHPNQQGLNCAMLGLSACFLGSSGSAPAAVMIAASVIATTGIALARSRSALWSMLAAIAWWTVSIGVAMRELSVSSLLQFSWPSGLMIALLASAASVSIFSCWQSSHDRGHPRDANMLYSRVMSLGRSDRSVRSLTGRLGLWEYIWRETVRSRFVGTGFGSFWTHDRVHEVNSVCGWRFADCHSAYFEVVVRSGLVGAAFFGAVIAGGAVSAFSVTALGGGFLPAFFVLVAVQGTLESTFVVPNFASLCWWMVIGCASV